MKFTQEVKDNWLAALKSGNYTQCTETLSCDGKHCCIGVLGDIHPELNNKDEGSSKSSNPYVFLHNTIGVENTMNLWEANDFSFDINKPDYSKVIPIIERLKVQE